MAGGSHLALPTLPAGAPRSSELGDRGENAVSTWGYGAGDSCRGFHGPSSDRPCVPALWSRWEAWGTSPALPLSGCRARGRAPSLQEPQVSSVQRTGPSPLLPGRREGREPRTHSPPCPTHSGTLQGGGPFSLVVLFTSRHYQQSGRRTERDPRTTGSPSGPVLGGGGGCPPQDTWSDPTRLVHLLRDGSEPPPALHPCCPDTAPLFLYKQRLFSTSLPCTERANGSPLCTPAFPLPCLPGPGKLLLHVCIHEHTAPRCFCPGAQFTAPCCPGRGDTRGPAVTRAAL